MEMTFRWFGDSDPVSLDKIRQIPKVTGIVSAIYDVPAGEAWPKEKIIELKNKVEVAGLNLSAIESVPVHEDIKLGKVAKERYMENYKTTIKRLGEAGIKVVCYNFMPVFDWTRSNLGHALQDGSSALIYKEEVIEKMNPVSGELELPGWDISYTKEDLKILLEEYKGIDEEKLWENLEYFIKEIVPVAEKCDVRMAIHPDDPPWPIFGLPRIITCEENIEKFLSLLDNPYNGLTLCSGSLGVDANNDIPGLVRKFGKKIHFAHMRNIKRTGVKSFEESAHCSDYGSLDMVAILRAYYETGFAGPMRPDHGRMIWGETGKPGYGLYDRALGASYLIGIWETLEKTVTRKRL